MPHEVPPTRSGEYTERGEYHRCPDAHWDYRPTYLAKLRLVREYLDGLGADARVLDAGCGEGILVDEYADRIRIEGVDLNYASARVRTGSLTALPFDAGVFDRVLCLDVLEHLRLDEQIQALRECARVLTPDGEALISVPNLAHLQSRVHFLLTGRLVRTANIAKHPGDRPMAEFVDLFRAAGFDEIARKGVFPTVPVLTRLVRRHPVSLAWLHGALTRLLPVPGWCFLNLIWLRKRG
jgi:SAM-dependent methyltransferase